MLTFVAGKTYSLQVLNSAILPGDYSSLRCMAGSMVAESAAKIKDIYPLHTRMLKMLPAGSPKTADQYTYVHFKDSNNNDVVLAFDWIVSDSVKEVMSEVITIVIRGRTSADVADIRNSLILRGITNVDITVQQNAV